MPKLKSRPLPMPDCFLARLCRLGRRQAWRAFCGAGLDFAGAVEARRAVELEYSRAALAELADALRHRPDAVQASLDRVAARARRKARRVDGLSN